MGEESEAVEVTRFSHGRIRQSTGERKKADFGMVSTRSLSRLAIGMNIDHNVSYFPIQLLLRSPAR